MINWRITWVIRPAEGWGACQRQAAGQQSRMSVHPFMIDPERLWPGAGPYDAALAIIDLEAGACWPDTIALPPCPLIGIGDPAHPSASHFDVIIEPPVTPEMIARSVVRNPEAAEIFVGLMRLHANGGLGIDAAFEAESLAYAVLQSGSGHRAWMAARDRQAGPSPHGQIALDRDHDCLLVMLDRIGAGNAIDRPMRDGLHAAFTLAALDPDISEIRLMARGRAFCVGADLDEFGTTLDPVAAHMIRTRSLPARALAGFRGLVSVHVQGACIGSGLEIAAFGSWITASPDAWFQLPELAMGIIPGAGGCVSLPRRIGRHRTALMVLSGRRINARTARDWGLVDAIVDDPA
jgi:enoyl-CoA hydratase/carnithine racemase